MTIVVSSEIFQPWQVLAEYEQHRAGLEGKVGASAVFVGTMSSQNQGQLIETMTLEHYPGMTEKHLNLICEEAAGKWEIMDSFVRHRYGLILPNEAIVLVATWSRHRQQALSACQYIIDELKTRAPFWKLEQTSIGQRWVEKNT